MLYTHVNYFIMQQSDMRTNDFPVTPSRRKRNGNALKSNIKSKTKINLVGTWNILETAPPLNFGRFWIWARKNRKRRKQLLENNGGKSPFVIYFQSKEKPGKWNGARAKGRRKEKERVLNGTFLPFFLTVWRGPPLSSFPRQRIEKLKSGRILLWRCTPSPSSYRSLRSPAIFLGGRKGEERRGSKIWILTIFCNF